MLLIAPIVGIAVHHETLMVFTQVLKRNVHRHLVRLAGLEKIVLGLEARAGLPWLDHASSDGEGAVGQGEMVVNSDDPPETFACGTCAHGVVEAEERGGWIAVFNIALGAMQSVRKSARSPIGKPVNAQPAFAKMIGMFTTLDKPRAIPILSSEAILNNDE